MRTVSSKTYIVDANIWIDFFQHDKFRAELTGGSIETPAVVLVELAGYFAKNRIPEEFSSVCFADIMDLGAVRGLDMEQALKAAKIKRDTGLPTIDAIIYSYVAEGKILLTQDSDMKGLPGVDYRAK
jgi:predicted nucleic acid-binding protein